MSGNISFGARRARRGLFRGLLRLAVPAGVTMGVALSSSGAARAADDHPPLTPMRDATVTYLVQPDGAPQGQNVKVWFMSEGAKMRVDAPDGSASTIIDRTANDVTIVLNRQRVFTRLEDRGAVRSPFLLDVGMQYTRGGSSSVAGVNCTLWQVVSGKGQATACVTSDGIILSEDGVDADGVKGKLTAQSVAYETIPASAFAPPDGYQEVHHHPVSARSSASPTLGTSQVSAPSGAVAAAPASTQH